MLAHFWEYRANTEAPQTYQNTSQSAPANKGNCGGAFNLRVIFLILCSAAGVSALRPVEEYQELILP